ncbi:MAG: arylsulfotransferase family protein [Rubrobacteraceae bacterium]|nr:arylsulfotransferase family protein [Rubrobacteraceae bacterium]
MTDERADLGNRARNERYGSGITRRRFLGAITAGTAWVALSGSLGCEQTARTRATAAPRGPGAARAFRSRPDLHPPAIRVGVSSRDATPGYIFVSPKKGPGERAPTQDAPLIIDGRGEPVWFHPLLDAEADAFNFRVQTYKGESVLTWWVGHHTGYGQGEYIIADHHYREVKRVRAGNGLIGDHHEFLITPQDTALITVYSKVKMDLTGVGGPVDGVVLDGIAQEVDIESGEVIFEWHSLDHVDLDESYYRPPPDLKTSFDYFHINSIDPYPDGYLTISARRTSTVYKVDRKTGEVVWRLGGKRSDFDMGYGTRTDWQHDARRHPDGRITIFDNGGVTRDVQSRGIVVEVDEDAMKATLVGEYTRPHETLAATQGNVQVLPNGNIFVGWGSEPYFSEFSHDGKLLFDARFPSAVESYRAFRFPWRGLPEDSPAVVAESGSSDEVTLYASWNGATEVATWQLLAGRGPDELEPVGSVPRKGFETAVKLQTDKPYVAVRAKDSSGLVLGTSETVKPSEQASSVPTDKTIS